MEPSPVPHNGVFLPTQRGLTDAEYHPSLHTDAYYAEVTRRLLSASSKDDVVDILSSIAQELLSGTFPK